MQITANTTRFRAELFASTDKDGRKRCNVVVKATFGVAPDGDTRIADEQVPFVYADEHHGDPGTTSIRYESDFVPIKPRAEVVLNASAHAPGERPVRQLEVSLEGSGIVKRALVTGDREWVDGVTGIVPSRPRPFVTMPLTWDRAFGGSDSSHERIASNGSELRNLVGVGFHLNSDARTILGEPLPNVERPDMPMRAWSDRPEPIGFAPVGRGWRPRIGFAGTFDQKWMDDNLPFLPDDFDNRYFQSAPLDQQLSELPAGAAWRCRHMDATGEFVVRLPPMAIPVRFRFEHRTESQTVRPDTVLIEPEPRRLVLIGRVAAMLPRKFTALREIEVGEAKRTVRPGKPHYRNLGDAVAALRQRR
jgi:hypothetical protein